MTRSGKSARASQLVADSPRVLVWDPQRDWFKHGYHGATSRASLLHLLEHTATDPQKISFVGEHDAGTFDWFCRAAFAWAKIEPAVIVVEELAWVSNAGKAPKAWHAIVTGGLKFGINLVSITQRPTEADKTTLSQADAVYCFQMERVDDQKYMGKELGVEPERVAELGPLQYIVKDRRARTVNTGTVTF